MKIKISKQDRVFSQCIRERDNHTCQWCGIQSDTIQTSHIYGRRGVGTRWHPLNAVSKCYACHRKWHESPVEAFKWIEGYLGTDKLDELRSKAHTTCKLSKSDREDIYQHYKTELERLQKQRIEGKTGRLYIKLPDCLK